MPREELITSTITIGPQPGHGQLCRYRRSEGWLDSFCAWDWTFSWPLSWLDLFLLSQRVLFLSFYLSGFLFCPPLLYVLLLLFSILFGTLDEVQLCIGHIFLNCPMELQLPLFPSLFLFCLVFLIGSTCLCLQMRQLHVVWAGGEIASCDWVYILMLISLWNLPFHFCFYENSVSYIIPGYLLSSSHSLHISWSSFFCYYSKGQMV